jgi:hypothetical protein
MVCGNPNHAGNEHPNPQRGKNFVFFFTSARRMMALCAWNVLFRQRALNTTTKVTLMPDHRPEDLTPEQLSQAGKELDEAHRALQAKQGELASTETDKTPPPLSAKPGPSSKGAAAQPQKLALIGALLVLIGFFVPWYSISFKAEVDRAVPGFPTHFLSDAPTMSISGGHIQHGLGWLVLILGVVAVLPYFAGNLPEQTRQRAILACLAAGAVILFYLLARDLRHVSIGIGLAVVGYGLQLAGALQSGRLSGHAAD